jgi:hypothetical protein
MEKKIMFLLCLCYIGHSNAQRDSLVNLNDSLDAGFEIPLFSSNTEGLESDIEQQDVSSLLQSSRDVFTQFAGFQFGAGRYRMRGYSAENQQVLINGINVNNPETGYSSWSSWGGLNDVTKYIENRVGNESNRYSFSGAGGYTNIDSKASSFKKGTRISYSNGNRMYRHRYMITHSTGLHRNGVAATISASSRTGNEVYIPGTYFRANAFYLSLDKKINEKHLLSFTGFIAPTEQGRAKATVLEAYKLAGSNYYNSGWGYQAGKVRNANISESRKPMLMLTHQWQLTTNTRLSTSAFYNFGKSGFSGLTSYKSPNPQPDYYRNLPGYYYLIGDTVKGDLQAEYWKNNNQINWDRMIAMNQANLYSSSGQSGLIAQESRARYMLENQVEHVKNKGVNIVLNSRVKKIFISSGINGAIYSNRKYKEALDLLGADYWIDVDQFAENLGIETFYQQNDIDNPDKKIYKGDKFGYDYSIHIKRAEAWTQGEFTSGKFDFYCGLSYSMMQVLREGHVANGKFPSNSKGLGETVKFQNPGLKAGVVYKITGRHFLSLNGSIISRPPEVSSMFIAPRVRHDLVTGIKNEEVRSAEINYLVKYSSFKLKFTLYNTTTLNQSWVRTYWHDDYKTNVNLIMKGLNQQNQGFEAGLEKALFTSHIVQVAGSIGRFIYTSRPTLEAWQDNTSKELYTGRTVYIKNYRAGSSPQTVAGISYRYNAKKKWFVAMAVNFMDQIYIEPNPDRRTDDATAKFNENEKELANRITAQERLPSYYIINCNAGKALRLKKKYFININAVINNLMNNKNIIVTGYEQLRWDKGSIEKFPPRYLFMPGITYMISGNFNF